MLDSILIDPSVYSRTGKKFLKLIDGTYTGKNCAFKYPVINGVPILKLPHDQNNDTLTTTLFLILD